MSDEERRWFGERRPGSAERVLERAYGGKHTPYEWLERAVADSAATVLDLACGTGSLTRRLEREGRTVVGVDLSLLNIEEAKEAGTRCAVQADAAQLPFADDSFDVVVTSLGLGMVTDRMRFLREVTRVLRPGGVFAGLTPSVRPFSVEDLKIASQLGGYLRATPTLPGLPEFRAKKTLAKVGLTKTEDSRARYHFTVASRHDAETLVAGLRTPPDRARGVAAVEFLTLRAEVEPVAVPLPMRRIVAIK